MKTFTVYYGWERAKIAIVSSREVAERLIDVLAGDLYCRGNFKLVEHGLPQQKDVLAVKETQG